VRKATMLFSYIVVVIINQLNILNKIEKNNFGENHKKTKTKKPMWRNIVEINNVLKKKIYKTKFSISSILKK
jgi:hypothetical protein